MRDRETKRRLDRSVLDGMIADEPKEYMDENVYWLKKFYCVFNCSLIDGVTDRDINRQLKPMLNKNDHFKKDTAVVSIKEYLQDLLVLSANEKEFVSVIIA